jgi:protein tyrosine phosphatase (PTP) superfamily phosphohydrolase (DUF442 family)
LSVSRRAASPARRRALAWLSGCALPLFARAADSASDATSDTAFDAPNIVPITPRLVTSGQPSATALAQLGARGYGAVIYLAPASVPSAVADEAAIVSRQGLAYHHLPIRFAEPTPQDYRQLAAQLDVDLREATGRKVLVHCEANFRASSMVFLYRTIALKEDPQLAYESVARVWTPVGAWRRYIVAMLRDAGVAFEPY